MGSRTQNLAGEYRPGLSYRLGAGIVVFMALYAALVAAHDFLCDDAFISFRYAQHLAEGLGLVFNAGERVEGYTNFSWVLLLAAGIQLGVAPEIASRVLSVACGFGVLACVLRETLRDASSSGSSTRLALLAPAALAVNRSFCAWSTGGLETMLFALLVLTGLVRFANEREHDSARPWASALLLAGATLTRPEGALFAAVCAATFLWQARRAQTARRAFGFWLTCFVPLPALHLGWRLWYYGDFVPNTFHAKVSGLWFEQGATYLWLFAREHSVIVLLCFAAVAVFRRGHPRTALLAACTASYTLYVAAVGGDRFEFRFMVPVLPLLALLVGEGLARVDEFIRSLRLSDISRDLARGLAALVILLAMAMPTLTGFVPSDGLASIETMRDYAERRSEEGRFLGKLVSEGVIPSDTRLAVTGAGALPYYAGLFAIDIHGLSEREVAQQPLSERGVIAHEKRASPQYLARREAAMIDLRDRIVEPQEGRPRPTAAQLEHLLARLTVPPPLTLRALYVRDRVLIFGTTLDDSAFRLRFARTLILR